MADVRMLFWRAVTQADFFEVERSPAASSTGGGGQSYFSISFAGITHEELGRFLGVEPPSAIRTVRPVVELGAVGVIDDPDTTAPLTFRSRYRPPHRDDRYRISRQNRQTQARHPAWRPERGFPAAPDDVQRGDPLPDLTYLKIYVARLDDGTYLAGYTNSGSPPAELAGVPGLGPLFAPFVDDASAGLIELGPGELPLETLAAAAAKAHGRTGEPGASPELVEVVEATRRAAGKRATGQGRGLSGPERRAVELHAMDRTREELEREGWDVDDVSQYRPYDLHCTRGSEELRMEAKGTTSSGEAVLLTPGEVRHARENPGIVGLGVVAGIALSRDAEGNPVASGGEIELTIPWDIDAGGELFATGYEYRRAT
jgi:hypothetical protein